ncbi:hypothetical protein GCM10022420_011670 [Streptomyces iranensis]
MDAVLGVPQPEAALGGSGVLGDVGEHLRDAECYGVHQVVPAPEAQMGTDDAANPAQYPRVDVQMLFVALGDLFNCHGGHGLSVTVGDGPIVDPRSAPGQVIPLMPLIRVKE